MSDPRIYSESWDYDDSVDDTEGRHPRPPGYLHGGPHYDYPDRLRPPEYPFGHASRPNWQPGYVPSATEWQSWFSRKYDTDDATLAGGPFMPVSGGRMHGPLILGRTPRLAEEAVTKAYVDSMTPAAGPFVAASGATPFTGDVTMYGGLQVAGNLHADCDLTVRRDLKVGQTLYVEGYSMFANNVDANADLTVTSTLYIGPLGAQGYQGACPPGDDEAALRQAMWGLWVDPTTGDRITSYTNGAYDVWRQATGMREWWAPGQTTALMTLDTQGNLTLLGHTSSAGSSSGSTSNTVISNGLVVNPAAGQQDAAMFNGGIQVNGDIAYSGLLRAAPGITTGITTADSLTIQATPGRQDALVADGNVQINGYVQNTQGMRVYGQIPGTSDGMWVEGRLECGGDVITNGRIYIGGSGNNFYLTMEPNGDRTFNWQADWYDGWRAADGLRYWNLPNVGDMTLDGGGNLYIPGVLSQGSDARLKRDIAPATVGLEQVLKLQPKTFKRVGDGRELGLIAQEVREVLPEAVIGNETLGITILPILAALIGAVQELNRKVEALSE